MIRHFISLIFIFTVFAVSAQDANTLSGTVTDDGGQAIGRASVRLLNTNFGTITDASGKFTLSGLDAGRFILQVSAIGYATRTVEVSVGAAESSDLKLNLSESSVQLSDVVVTAQKQEEDKQKIPATISTLSSEQVQQYRLWNTRELTAIIPNMFSNNSGDNRNVTSIRGITTTSYDPAVATYVDGVNQFTLDTYIPQLMDIERIEVLSGPQGTLYGRNAMAGVINIITRQPTNTPSGFAELNIGNYGQTRYAIGYRTPLIPNKLYFGISGVYEKTSGYYTNLYNNSDFDKRSTFTANYFLKYNVSQRWALSLNMKTNSNRNDGAFPLAGSVDEALSKPFTVNQNAVTKLMDNNFNASLVASYSGDKINFFSQSAYQSNYRYYKNPIDGDFSPADIITIVNNYGKDWNNVKVLTQEFKFSSPASLNSPFKWTAGTYMFHQYVPNKQATHFGEDAGFYGIPDTNFSTINTTTAYANGIAVYGQGTYTFLDHLDVTLGFRYDYEHKKQTVGGAYQHDPDPTVIVTQPDTTGRADFNAISPKVAVAYRVGSHTYYVSYARGFRAGGMTQASSDPTQPPLYAYKPEYSNNYEVGMKHHFLNNKVMVNLSAFYIKVTDAQVPTLVLPDAITVTRNAGELTSKGIDLQISTTPAKNLQFDYNFGFNDARYTKLNLPGADENGDGQPDGSVSYKNNKQIFTPAFTSMAALQYGSMVGPVKLTARGEWMLLGDQYFDLPNTIKQDSYSLFNVRAGAAYDRFELMFWGRNLGDQHYIAYAYNFGATHLGDPRTYGVTFRANF
jgi:iron complex outermembrane receptor protein